MTERLYQDSASTVGTAIITGVEDGERPALRLDRTHFHPQGGGQQADIGWIEGSRVVHVENLKDGGILHHMETVAGFEIGQRVSYRVRFDARTLAARLHTAGHLVAGLAVQIDPSLRPKAGHHWPGQARVDFVSPASPPTSFADSLAVALREAIAYDLAVEVSSDAGTPRTVRIGELEEIPCGGTHVRSLAELVEVQIRKVKFKKGVLRVGYDVSRSDDKRRSPNGLDILLPEQAAVGTAGDHHRPIGEHNR